jgi:putative membrane protein
MGKIRKDSKMKRFLIHLVVNAVALYAAVAIMNGYGIVPQSTNWLSFIWLALIFGLINAILKPLLTVLSCPLIILTLGLGTLLINTLLFYLAGLFGQAIHAGFTVDGFWPAFLGALIVSVVSFILSIVLRDATRKS